MRKALAVVGLSLLVGLLLVACSNEDDTEGNGSSDNGTSEEQGETGNDVVNEDRDDGEVELDGERQFGDQLDLGIGDTAQIASNTGEFEVTIESVEYTDEQIDGESSLFDAWIIADITVTNIGETTLAPENTIGILEITSDLEGSGAPDYSSQFESTSGLEVELEPGETASGQALFVIRDNDEQFIRVNSGLIAADGVKNNAIWTFDTEDAKN